MPAARRLKKPLLATLMLLSVSVQALYADIANGRYGVNQVFDVQRSPAFPVSGQPFTASSFAQPFDDNIGQYDISTGYIKFFYTGNVNYIVGIQLYTSTGTLVTTASPLGNIYGLADEGFLYVSDVGYGTFVSNGEGFAYGDSITFTAGPDLATLADLQAYVATTQVLGIGQTAASLNGAVANASRPELAAAASQLDAVFTAGSDTPLNTALNSLSTDQQRASAVAQTLPVLAGVTTSAMAGTLQTITGIVQARNSANSGISTGDDFVTDNNVWAKPFGSWANQNDKNGATGFSTSSRGMVAGLDGVLDDTTRIGFALAYADTNVSSNDSRHRVDIDSLGLAAYGSRDLGSGSELSAETSIGFNRNSSGRIINIGGLDRLAEADYTSFNFSAGTGIAQVMNVTDNLSFIPSARADYLYFRNNSYTESGAGGLSLNVKSQQSDKLVPALDGKLQFTAAGNFNLSANAGVGYDVLNQQASVTSSYVGGGGTFQTPGIKATPWALRSGVGLDYTPTQLTTVKLSYQREDRGSFDNQTLSLRVGTKF